MIDSVNAVFARMMGKEMGGIVYDEKAALHPGAAYPVREGGLSESGPTWHLAPYTASAVPGGEGVR